MDSSLSAVDQQKPLRVKAYIFAFIYIYIYKMP